MKDIPNTPFKLVTLEQGHFIAYGNNRLSDIVETEKDAMKIIEEKSWDFIGTFVISVVTSFDNLKNSQK